MLGDQYEMPALQNEVTRAFIAALQTLQLPLKQISEVFDVVSTDCPIRTLLAEEMVVEVINGTYTWRDLEHLIKYEGVFAVFMNGWQDFLQGNQTVAQYGANAGDVGRFMVNEELDDELEASGAGLIGA